MSKQLIMLQSITYAMKGRDILQQFGISAFIERTPKNVQAGSCGYSLGVYVPQDIDRAIEILSNNGIQVLGITDRVVL